MSTLVGDLRQACRVLVTSRLTAAAAIATLALGIGANAALFSLVNAVLLRPLPYAEPDRLVVAWQNVHRLGLSRVPVSLPELFDYRAQSSAFEAMEVYRLQTFTYADLPYPEQQYPQQIGAATVSAGLLTLLGVDVARGRAFAESDHDIGRERVVVISDSFWRRVFHAAPSALGDTITLNGVSHTIAGILPADFQLLNHRNVELLVPATFDAAALSAEARDTRTFSLLARLRRGVSIDRAEQELRALVSRLSTGRLEGLSVRLVRFDEELIGDVRRPLILLMLAVGFVLLIGCANVAHLSLARAAAREREMAIRVALGAGRARLVRQLLTESLLLAAAGGAIGLLAAIATLDLLVRFSPASLPRVEQTRIDGWVLLFSAAITLGAGTLFGLFSAFQASRPDINQVLKDEATSTRSRRGTVRSVLVGSEVALALALLVCAGLVVRGFIRLVSEDAGFDARGVQTMVIDLPAERYPEQRQREAFYRQVIERVAARPEVERAGITSVLPLSGDNWDFGFTIPGRPLLDPNDSFSANWRLVSDGYLEAMGIPLRRGRLFTPHDTAQAPGVAIINETMARTWWPKVDPVGQSIKLGGPKSDRPVLTIVGVVGDVRFAGLHLTPLPEMYTAYGQLPAMPLLFRYPPMTLAIRTRTADAGGASLARTVRTIVRELDPTQAIGRIASMEDVLTATLAPRRVAMRLLGAFAVMAWFLAVIGTYGVVSYSVGQRTREIGVRMALGAERQAVVQLILAQAARPVIIGLAIGVVVAWASAHLLVGLLHGISPADPLTLAAAPLLMGVVTTAASWAPAWRAATVDPVIALRPGAETSTGSGIRRRARAVAGRLTEALQQRRRRPATEESHLLTELAAATRAARTIDELFALVAETLRTELAVESVAIYTRDGQTGHYVATTCQPAPREHTRLTLDGDAFSVRRLQRLSAPLAIEEGELDTWLRALESASPDAYERRRRECVALRAVRASWLVPIRMKGEMIGILAVGGRAEDRPFAASDRDLLVGLAAQTAFLIQNASLVGRLAEQERLTRELKTAAAVQQRLLPERAPDIASLDLAGFCRPARTVGGDYYDFVRLNEDSVGLVLADVAGKGMSAALLMAVVQASWRSLAPLAGADVSGLVGKIDRLLYDSTGDASYATMFCARYEEGTRRLQFVNAGHNPPFVLELGRAGAGTRPVTLVTGGPAIGLLPAAAYEDEAIVLHPGDLVIAYTDGITEALDPAGEEFGEARLLAAIGDGADGSAAAIAERIRQAVLAWIGEAPQYDDLTVMVLKGR